jgi:hypothetical protein
MTDVVLFVALVLSLRTQDPKLPAFSAGDQLAAAKALCGNVARGTVKDTIGGDPEIVKGFVGSDHRSICIELLSVSYAERGASRHVVFFGEHYVDEDGVLDSGQGAHATLHAALFEHRGGTWTMVIKQTELAETGFNGRDPAVALRKTGADRHAVEVIQSLWNAGSSATSASLYEPAGQEFAEILDVSPSANDCGQHDKCFEYDGTIAYDEASDPKAFDITLTLKGTYRNANGRIVKVPAAPLVFRFANGKYAPVIKDAATRALWEGIQSPW